MASSVMRLGTVGRPAPDRLRGPGLVVCALVILALPFVVGGYWQAQIVSIAILAMMATGLNLTFGYGGELALHQAAVFAVSAYAATLAMNNGIPIIGGLVVGLLAALVIGLLTGFPGLRLSSWSLALLTFFLVTLVGDLILILGRWTGGPNGLTLDTIVSGRVLYWWTLGSFLLWLLIMRNLLLSQWGLALRVLRQSPVLAQSLGINVYKLKFTAYVVGALPAGLAGVLFALSRGFISPSDFGINLGIQILAAAIIGGLGSLYGPVFGAIILTIIPQEVASFDQYSLLVYGLALALVIVFLPGGASSLYQRILSWAAGRLRSQSPAAATAAADTMMDPLDARPRGPVAPLSIEAVTLRFDGVVALNDAHLTAAPGQIHGLVGPNGSGKTTLLNVICGYVRPESGAIALGDVRLSFGRSAATARYVARTFQTPRIPESMTVLDAVRVAEFSRRPYSVAQVIARTRKWRHSSAMEAARARQALAWVGLAGREDARADALSLGQKRLLEIARAIARAPRVLLLDEPASGLSEDEIGVLVDVLARLAGSDLVTILVEHNAGLIGRVADTVTCLASGAVIAEGVPAEVLTDDAVLSAWLGTSEVTAAGAPPLQPETAGED